ncbi:MAG: hypothetical protein L3K04_00960 [Thermoplasmata archaeon]|nr:hypothetical protein [Thermoplasmata archaeon]MCI4338005.1 hypothetical protein [Thermoplasmata archaeon]MCI4340814.1 hypothetical protein [Thermoplasmata archaeon]
MKLRPTPEMLLTVPVLLYLPVAGGLGLTNPDAGFLLGFLLAAAPLGGLLLPDRWVGWWCLPALAFGAVGIAVLTSGFNLRAPWDSVLAGAVLGVPLALLATLLGAPVSAPNRFLILVVALGEGLGLRASAGGSPPTIARNFLGVQSAQLGGLGAWAHGIGNPVLPLTSANDPLFLGLALLGLGGAILGLLSSPGEGAPPRSGREFDLWVVTISLGAGGLFEALALGEPIYALLILGLGVVVCTLWLVLVPRGVSWPGFLSRAFRR